MKAIATVLFGAAAAVGACLIGAAAATYIRAVPEGQHLGNLQTAGPGLQLLSASILGAKSSSALRPLSPQPIPSLPSSRHLRRTP